MSNQNEYGRAAKAASKEIRERDAALARKDYEAERVAVAAKTARLRALRLAKEAGEQPPGNKQAASKKKKK
jgi:hypothetical protein